jgi:hypothetical protein
LTILGSKLPEPYFTLVVQSKLGFRRFRRCLTCGFVSTTVEIPLALRSQGSPADCCPNHPRTKSVILHSMTPAVAIGRNAIGQGILKAISVGGVWRRRGCGLNYIFCKAKNKNYLERPLEHQHCRGKDGKPMRWTTLELDSTGVVVRDVSVCSNCGGTTRSYRGTKARFEAWRT